MRRSHLSVVVFLLLACAITIAAQVPNEGLVMKIAQARKADAALMHQYMWNCRTEFLMNGEVKDIRLDQEMYGPDGQIQKTELNNQSFSHPHGFLRKRIAEDKKEELEKYMGGLKKVLEQYTLPTAGKMIDFLASANVQFVQAPNGSPLLMIQGNNVIQPGDNLSVWADPTTHAFRKVQVTTTDSDGDPVNLTVTFKTIPPGLTFASMAEVDLPAKNITVQVHNYDYIPND